MENPIVGTCENEIYKIIDKTYLSPIFIASTQLISEHDQKTKNTVNANQQLKRIIKLDKIEVITAATREGLDRADLSSPSEKLLDVLNSREKKLEKKLTEMISKNFLGNNKKSPVAKLILKGPKKTQQSLIPPK